MRHLKFCYISILIYIYIYVLGGSVKLWKDLYICPWYSKG